MLASLTSYSLSYLLYLFCRLFSSFLRSYCKTVSVNWRACDILAPMVVFWPPELSLKSGELCGKTRHTFFSSARKVPYRGERLYG